MMTVTSLLFPQTGSFSVLKVSPETSEIPTETAKSKTNGPERDSEQPQNLGKLKGFRRLKASNMV
jgi:hypothetical protein